MKNFQILIPAIALCLLVSCNSNTAGSSTTSEEQKNLETARAIAKMFEAADWSKTSDYIAADAVDHAGMGGDVKGADSIKAYYTRMGTMMGNFKNDVERKWRRRPCLPMDERNGYYKS